MRLLLKLMQDELIRELARTAFLFLLCCLYVAFMFHYPPFAWWTLALRFFLIPILIGVTIASAVSFIGVCDKRLWDEHILMVPNLRNDLERRVPF